MKQLEKQDLWCTTQPLNIPCNHQQIPGICHHGHMQGRQPHAHGGKEPEEKQQQNNTLTSKDAQSWIKPKSYSVKLECFHTRLILIATTQNPNWRKGRALPHQNPQAET